MSIQDKLHRAETALRAVIGIGVVLILFIFSFMAFNRFLDNAGARTALYNAKIVRLAAESVSSEYFASGKSFYDPYSESGFSAGAASQVVELSAAEGDICLLKTGSNGYGVKELSYVTGDYTVRYTASGDSGSWQVYKKTVLISS